MSPTYEYRCPDGHLSDRICRYEDRPKTVACQRCGRKARPIISLVGIEPDGVHSYMPNLGSPEAFERRQQMQKDGVKVYPKEAVQP